MSIFVDMENNTRVYRHIRKDTNEVFYVGIGRPKRPYTKTGRSKWWKSIVAKTEYRVDILFDDLTYTEACEKEIELIALYGRKDLGLGTLVNLTDGGDTTTGYKHTEESKRKMSESSINPSTETRAKLSKAASNRIVTEETKYKMSKSSSGGTSGMKGKEHSSETKRKMSNKQFKRAVVQLDLEDNVVNYWESSEAAAKMLGFDTSSIHAVCKNNPKRKTHKGFKWRYKNGN